MSWVIDMKIAALALSVLAFLFAFTPNPASANQTTISPFQQSVAIAYARQLLTRMEKHEFWPRHASPGVAIIKFRVDKEGNLVSERIDKSSGSSKLDKAALKIVRRAFPYKPPPGAERITYRIPITFSHALPVPYRR